MTRKTAKCKRCGLETAAGELTISGVCALPRKNREACVARQRANLIRVGQQLSNALFNVAQDHEQWPKLRELINEWVELRRSAKQTENEDI